MADLTLNQKLLVAAGGLGETFTAEDLTVAVWKIDKRGFGLRGYWDEYPDSNKVYPYLMGQRGMVQTGRLKKIGPKVYALDRIGRQELAEINDRPNVRQKMSIRKLDQDIEDRYCGLIQTFAYARWQGRQAAMIGPAERDQFLALGPAEVVAAGRQVLRDDQYPLVCGGTMTARELDKIDGCRVDLERQAAEKRRGV